MNRVSGGPNPGVPILQAGSPEYEMYANVFFDDDDRVIEALKVKHKLGKAEAMQRYHLSEEDVSLLDECMPDVFLSSKKEKAVLLSILSSEGKEGVKRYLEAEFGLHRIGWKVVVRQILEALETDGKIQEIHDRVVTEVKSHLPSEKPVKEPITAEEKEKKRLESALKKYSSQISRIKNKWNRKTFFLGAMISEIQSFTPSDHSPLPSMIDIMSVVLNKKPWNVDIGRDKKRFADIIYADEAPQQMGEILVDKREAASVYHFQAPVVNQDCPEDIKNMVQVFKKDFIALKHMNGTQKYVRALQHVNNLWSFIQAEYSLLTFVEVEQIYETFFESSHWLPEGSDDKAVLGLAVFLRGKRRDVLAMLEQKAVKKDHIIALLGRREITQEMRERLVSKNVEGRGKKLR